MIRVTPVPGDLSDQRADLTVHFQFEGEPYPATLADPALRKSLAEIARLDGFEGKQDSALLWHSNGRPAARFLVMGLGRRKNLSREVLHRASAVAGSRSVGLRARRVGLVLPPLPKDKHFEEAAGLAAGGFLHGLYRFDKYLSAPRNGAGPEEILVGAGEGKLKRIRSVLEEVQEIDRVSRVARDLISEHPGYLHPEKMAEVAVREARKSSVKCRLMSEPEMKRLGMGGMLGVSRGSEHPAVMIHLSHVPRGAKKKPRVVLVGKGVTFDTGGISLKQPEGMEAMKADMSGAAAVLGTMLALPALGIGVEVHGLLMMVENMPDGRAIRPGDVLRMANGKTVEIKSTDAEGRLILADGLSWACATLKPDFLIDLATLTGACMVALGPGCTGVMSNNDRLVRRILDSAEEAGERMWQLPLFPEYREHIRSDVADIKNSGIRYGGAITAGLFLQEFVQPDVAWAHLDIAGPAYFESAYGYAPKGATGHGIRTLIRFLRSLS
ncbi:MAG TPA: leucyl aminopeptidase [Candidatus Polarisedimenticolia bacterium]|nr:leucyl aminopeptidase [Candidatus Polarisedimenticolia bacterium]